MRILILGVKGNLGGQIVKVFEEDKNYEVIAWDREEIDITDKELIIRKIKDIKPNIIINAAAYNAVDKCELSFAPPGGATENKDSEEEYVKAKKLNGDAVGYLADAAIKNNCLLVHYSSDYVFGKNANDTNKERMKRIIKQGGYKEDDEPCPVNKYGETKLMGERELITRSGKGLKFYLIRTSKLFGPKGESQSAKQSFFDVMLSAAVKAKADRKDFLDVVNEEASCFTYTPDLAKTTKRLVESGKGYGIYHIVNSGACTWYEAATELFKLVGVKIKVNPVASDKFPRPAKRPKYSVLLNTKFEKMRSWQEALREYLVKST